MDEIKQYLVDFQSRKFNTFERELKLKPSREFISSIIGARRTGKTYILFDRINRLKDRREALYIDFDSPEFIDFDGRRLKEIINLHYQLYGKLKYVFFDEIQILANWQRGLKEIYEEKKYFIFITGSSSKLLSRELATELRGRAITYNLFPLSLREIIQRENLTVTGERLDTEKKNKIIFHFNRYVDNGGYPQIFLEPRLKDSIVKDYKDLVLFRDVVERYGLKNLYVAKRFFEYLISSFSKEISVDKFYRYLKSQNIAIGKPTLYNYLEYFSDSLFFHFLPSQKSRDRIRKVYLNDGVFGGEEKGRRLENLALVELLRRQESIYYFKDKFECDFVIPKKEALQICWELNSDNKDREVKGILAAAKYYKITKAKIITYNQEEAFLKDGVNIAVVPFWKWVLFNKFTP